MSGPTANPVNAWTHVALTYDGTTRGCTSTAPRSPPARTTGTIQATDNPLWIGGNNPYGEYFTRAHRRRPRLQPRAHPDRDPDRHELRRRARRRGDTTPPSAPTGLTATAAAPTQVNLGWTASTDNVGVTGYRVERCQGAGCTNFAQVGTPTGTTLQRHRPGRLTTYRYRVRAVDAAGNLSALLHDRDGDDARRGATPRRRRRPTALSATAISTTQIDLGWTASTDNVGVTGYRVERCQGAGCTTFAQVGTPTGTTFSDTGLTANTTYRYRVRAVDAAGNLSALLRDRHGDDARRADTTPPSAPTALSATAISATRINLGWTASTDNVGVTGYRVERCQGASCTNFAQVGTPTGTTFSDTGPDGHHHLPLPGARGRRGRQPRAPTPPSSPRRRPRRPTRRRRRRPPGLTATAVSTTQINLGWTASTDNVGVTGYRVERCQGASCTTFAQVGTPTGTTYSDTGLTATTTYRYRVRAVDAAGNLGAYSAIVDRDDPRCPTPRRRRRRRRSRPRRSPRPAST